MIVSGLPFYAVVELFKLQSLDLCHCSNTHHCYGVCKIR